MDETRAYQCFYPISNVSEVMDLRQQKKHKQPRKSYILGNKRG